MNQEQVQNLVDRLREQPELIDDLDPNDFSELIAFLLRSSGFEVTLAEELTDYGFYLVAVSKEPPSRLIVQCKLNSGDKKVELSDVSNLYDTADTNEASRAMLVTTSSFTKAALDFANQVGRQIELVDINGLRNWLDQFVDGRSFFGRSAVLNSDPIRLLIDPGSAKAEDLAELYYEISKFYRMMGGPGIDFRVVDAREPAFVEGSL